jgi:monomeric isocitrate dehydrogenase
VCPPQGARATPDRAPRRRLLSCRKSTTCAGTPSASFWRSRSRSKNEAKIDGELLGAQGKPVDLGYYHFDDAKTFAALRPNPTLNAAIDGFS